jgi:serine/threonine protein kinase
VVSSFIDEANLASSLVHSNILPVFDFGKIGDEYYMATEYILGRDLGKLSRQAFEVDGAPLPLGLIFFAAHQTLEALDYAHHKKGDDGVPLGIVHRDISPNNILVSARGEVKLFDFGIAKAEGRLTQTTFGTVKGNVRFMSPEQARGEPVDPRSDLFSVGLVIYFALTGEAFYEGDTAYSLLVKAAHGPGEAERARLAKLPKEARAILERALALDPAHRFQGAAEFAAALSPYIAGQQAALGRMMERLFGQELHEEQTRFAAAAAAVGDAEKAEAAPAHEASKA